MTVASRRPARDRAHGRRPTDRRGSGRRRARRPDPRLQLRPVDVGPAVPGADPAPSGDPLRPARLRLLRRPRRRPGPRRATCSRCLTRSAIGPGAPGRPVAGREHRAGGGRAAPGPGTFGRPGLPRAARLRVDHAAATGRGGRGGAPRGHRRRRRRWWLGHEVFRSAERYPAARAHLADMVGRWPAYQWAERARRAAAAVRSPAASARSGCRRSIMNGALDVARLPRDRGGAAPGDPRRASGRSSPTRATCSTWSGRRASTKTC